MTRTTFLAWLAVGAAITATAIGVVILVRLAPISMPPPQTTVRGREAEADVPGVHAMLQVGDVIVRRRLPALAFAIRDQQTLDLRLPPGPFDAELVVVFDPGPVRRARVGAELEGGALAIERRGSVLVSAEAVGETATVMTDTLFLPGRLNTFTYRFRRTGAAARLRGLWQPEGSPVALPLPGAPGAPGAGPILAEAADTGYALMQQLNCAACHTSADPDLQQELQVSPAPFLGRVGARARAEWIRRWIARPAAVKRGVAMPALFGDADTAQIDDLVHFLVAMGGPIDDPAKPRDPGLVETGRALYHRIGCMACHGALDPPTPTAHAAPPGALGLKTTVGALSAFLADPLQVRPSARMPAHKLTDLEARSIAAYLIDGGVAGGKRSVPQQDLFVIDPVRAQRGRRVFAERGCANCHRLGHDRPEIESALTAPALEQVIETTVGAEAGPRGCLGTAPPPGTPDFKLTEPQRAAVAAFLATLWQRRSLDVPHLRLATKLARLNCLACHALGGAGGPAPAIARFFATERDLDLGDEGRLPPDLHDVGARLNPSWLRAVLVEAGTARPYMTARMPQYGQAVTGDLPALFAAGSGVWGVPDHGPVPSADDAEIGRNLAGSGGLNCIQCHSIAGRDATDLPGVDLVQMTERLRYGYFARWMHDPKRLRAGTRMPSFFLGGRSGLTDYHDGDAARQIAAMWSYLSQGEFLPLPEGLTGRGSYALNADDEPIVFRTFMKDVGPRAIACGFPEQIHVAFDAAQCALRLVWVGRFLDAQGAWAARGGSETNPDQEPVWVAPQRPVFRLGAESGSGRLRFRGYRLDEQRRPIFDYDVESAGVVIHVSEQPIPRRDGEDLSLLRRFDLKGPRHGRLVVDLPGHRVVGDAPPVEDTTEIRLDERGRAAFTAELRW